MCTKARRQQTGRLNSKPWPTSRNSLHLELRPKFARLRAGWTYMTKAEKLKPAFVRPKRWFPKSQYKKSQGAESVRDDDFQRHVFGFSRAVALVADIWASLFRHHVGPFLKNAFPRKRNFQILIYGEQLLHAPVANAAMRDFGVTVLPDWSKYSPTSTRRRMSVRPRRRKCGRRRRMTIPSRSSARAVSKPTSFPNAENLVGPMANRIKHVLDGEGAMTRH